MSIPLTQHQIEIQRNLQAWNAKPLLQQIYREFYRHIVARVDPSVPGRIVEIGSGIGNLKAQLPQALATDLFPNSWLDLACDGYELPFRTGSLSHLVLFDVFHHLQAPNAFLREARRALGASGRLIIFDPFISWGSLPVYGLLHHEPVAMGNPIDERDSLARPRDYYAAQGNATRLFFRNEKPGWPKGWTVAHAEAFSCFYYLLSGGYSKPAVYPARFLGMLENLESKLSRWPKLFAGRCLIELRPT